MNKKRDTTIDFLRGFAVFLMFLIHTTAYFLSNGMARIVWNYTHIAVPLFIFCSAYIYFKRGAYSLNGRMVVKRIKRLILPYYLYLVALFATFFILDPSSLTIRGIIKKFLFFQGRDLNWLVVLFLLFIPLFSFLEYIYERRPILLKMAGGIALATSAFLLFHTINLPFRYSMWLPWCVYLIFTLFYAKQVYSKKTLVMLLMLSAGVYVLSRYLLIGNGYTLTLTENKYPPNIFYLSYGIFWTILLYQLHLFLDARNVVPTFIQKTFNFISVHSYSLFFIHFWYVMVLRKIIDYKLLQWWGFFVVVVGLSIATQILINKMERVL